jgi:hypothetical protein
VSARSCRVAALRHDAFQPELAGVKEDKRAVLLVEVLVELKPGRRAGEHAREHCFSHCERVVLFEIFY